MAPKRLPTYDTAASFLQWLDFGVEASFCDFSHFGSFGEHDSNKARQLGFLWS